MAGVKDLFNRPSGADTQISIAHKTKDLLIYGEAVLTIVTPIAIGLLPPELAPTIIKAYAIQLIAAGLLAFGFLESRLNRLQELRSERKTN